MHVTRPARALSDAQPKARTREWRLVVPDTAAADSAGDGGAAAGSGDTRAIGTTTAADRSAPAADGATNMAIDQALLDAAAHDGAPRLRFYRWRPACLSLGRNQPARGCYDGPDVRPGRNVVRRPTGGLAVMHDREITYAVVASVDELGGPRACYRAVNRALVESLRSLGVPAGLAGEDAVAPRPDQPGGACFAAPAPGEVVAGGRKLVGSAQRRQGRALLQHGSVLIGGRQQGAEDGVVTLEQLLPQPPSESALVRALLGGFESVLGILLAPAPLLESEKQAVRAHERRFRSATWTWRR